MIVVEHLSRKYPCLGANKKDFISVNDVSFSLLPNTSYALVGESGSGKSTLSMMLSAIIPPSNGTIHFNNKNIWSMTKEEILIMRKNVQLVLQDSSGALDPKKTIIDSLYEPLHKLCNLTKSEIYSTIISTLVKMELPESVLSTYPHELSGGQQSRVCIARAICVEPKYIIFDESVSGLDATVRKKILDLLIEIRKQRKITYLFITHDIDVALYMASHIFVMKGGKIIEEISNATSYDSFHGEYSRELIASLPPDTPYGR